MSLFRSVLKFLQLDHLHPDYYAGKKYIIAYEKYEDDETGEIEEDESTCRIVAVKNFGDVKKGQWGGIVENENNLSHEGDCWIYPGASVTGDAKVYGNAKIRGSACIRDHAEIFDDAEVTGEVTVSGDAKIYGNAVVSKRARVGGDAEVFDNAVVSDRANVEGDARIHGDAKIVDRVFIFGSTVINDKVISGQTRIFDNKEF